MRRSYFINGGEHFYKYLFHKYLDLLIKLFKSFINIENKNNSGKNLLNISTKN